MTFPATAKITDGMLDPKWMTMQFDEALSGVVQSMTGPDAIWQGQLSVLVRTGQAERDWQGFIDSREGTLNPFGFDPSAHAWCGLPRRSGTASWTWDSTSAPTMDSTSAAYTLDETDDVVTATIHAAASQHAAILTIQDWQFFDAWRPGRFFNVNGKMYRVAAIISAINGTTEMRIAPRLRAPATVGTQIEAPSVSLRLRDEKTGRIERSGRPQVVTLDVIEHLEVA